MTIRPDQDPVDEPSGSPESSGGSELLHEEERPNAGPPDATDDPGTEFAEFRRRSVRQRRLRRLAIAMLCVASILLTAAGALYWLSLAPPSWWKPPNSGDEEASAIADALEAYLVTEANRVRPSASPGGPDSYRSAEWDVIVGEEEVNAWLATRLPRWAASRGKTDRLVQLHFRESGLSIGTRLGNTPRVVSAELAPLDVRERGAVLTMVRDFKAGRLPLAWTGLTPAGLVGSAAPPPGQDTLGSMKLEADEGEIEVEMRSIANLADGRRVRLVRARASDGYVELTFVTEK